MPSTDPIGCSTSRCPGSAQLGEAAIGSGPDRDEYGYLWWRVALSAEDASRAMIAASGLRLEILHGETA